MNACMKKCAHNSNTNITLSILHPTQGGQTSYHFMQETVRSNAIPTAYIVNSKKQVVWMGHAMRVGPALEATLVEDTPFCLFSTTAFRLCCRAPASNISTFFHV